MLALDNNALKYAVGEGATIGSALSARPARSVLASFFSYDTVKRIVDLLVAPLALIILSPIMIAVALLIYISSPGPVVFKQRRLSYGNRFFTMYKFRTMRLDAESGTGPVWAKDDDPRVTGVGRFLRLTRLDELPQLINVVLGDMSLIGPRPERPEIAEKLAREMPLFNRRLEVKAGITGLAQISGGYAACSKSYRRKVALDILYVEKRGPLLDLWIAVQTVWVILTRKGAK